MWFVCVTSWNSTLYSYLEADPQSCCVRLVDGGIIITTRYGPGDLRSKGLRQPTAGRGNTITIVETQRKAEKEQLSRTTVAQTLNMPTPVGRSLTGR